MREEGECANVRGRERALKVSRVCERRFNHGVIRSSFVRFCRASLSNFYESNLYKVDFVLKRSKAEVALRTRTHGRSIIRYIGEKRVY